MKITQEYNVDCASQKMVIVMGEIGIYLKGEVRQFSSLLPGTVQKVHICVHLTLGIVMISFKLFKSNAFQTFVTHTFEDL
jgi:hypothetical protein